MSDLPDRTDLADVIYVVAMISATEIHINRIVSSLIAGHNFLVHEFVA